MQSNTAKASELISKSIDAGIRIQLMDGEAEMQLNDYNISESASIDFDYEDPVHAVITLEGECADANLWVDKEDAQTLADVFSDLAKDIEARE